MKKSTHSFLVGLRVGLLLFCAIMLALIGSLEMTGYLTFNVNAEFTLTGIICVIGIALNFIIWIIVESIVRKKINSNYKNAMIRGEDPVKTIFNASDAIDRGYTIDDDKMINKKERKHD